MAGQSARAPSTTHWRKVHKRKNVELLFAEDVGPVGTYYDLEVVDSGVAAVTNADGKKDMPWIAFAGAKKRLALNVTNCKTMQSLCGTGVVEEWRGWVRLVVVETQYMDMQTKKRETTDAIRIDGKRPPPRARGTDKAPPPVAGDYKPVASTGPAAIRDYRDSETEDREEREYNALAPIDDRERAWLVAAGREPREGHAPDEEERAIINAAYRAECAAHNAAHQAQLDADRKGSADGR